MKYENHLFTIGKKKFYFEKTKYQNFVSFSLMPNRALSHDGKKHVVTVPGRLRKLQGIEPRLQHEGTSFSFE